MLNKKVFLTTLKNNFDTILDRVDEKITNILPCYKREVEVLRIPLQTILASKVTENDNRYLILVNSLNLKIDETYNCYINNSSFSSKVTSRNLEGSTYKTIMYQDYIAFIDKATFIDGSPTSNEGTTVVEINLFEPTTDLVLKKVEIRLLPNYLLQNDLVVNNSISIGRKDGTTIGEGSSAIGSNVEASGNSSHAEGDSTTASSDWSHAEGIHTTASSSASHAEGYFTTASGNNSHAEGDSTIASGEASHAEGSYTEALGQYQHVQGKYNIEDTENKYAHIVGNGTSNARSNAHTLDWEGNAWFAGDVFVGGSDNSSAEKLVTKSYVEEFATKANGIKDVIALKDQVTGENYFLQIRNGVLVTSLMPAGIQLKTSPTKTTYYEGDCFEISDIELELVNTDGTTSLIEDVDNISTVQECMTLDMTFVTIKYNYNGFDFTVDIPITVNEFDPAVVLIDFYYTDNGNGTYTITDWKGTKDGVSSTELVVPNNNKIIL